ncbi:hypothetical protein GCM10011349_23670 [Novosphingobium indicum]|uniref:Uncharacterized protein n=1 Tax=Novosphingobium indicum TaxID=462949 RepID=A0ABQ2JR58_9SPHN|nr:hypothetical protein [Novosphingobium indicum]GGN51255.1 hypothetical protein GCM10011349_23670 [Novosphingobium indicum]
MTDYFSPEALQALAANDNDPVGIVRIPPSELLLTKAAIRRMAIAYRALLPCSRYKLVDLLDEIAWGFEGVIVGAEGRSIDPLSICADTIMRTDEDPSCSWLGAFLRFAVHEPKQAPQKRTLPRLELLYLVLVIRYPSVAARITA